MKRTQADNDWQNRILCSDESCIGTIGKDNRCRECGLPFGSESPETASSEDAEDRVDPGEDLDDSGEEELDAVDSPSDNDWDKRVLCNDESCIGTIGPDGRCRECGLS